MFNDRVKNDSPLTNANRKIPNYFLMKFGVNINNAFVITSKGQIIQIPNTSMQLSFCQCHMPIISLYLPQLLKGKVAYIHALLTLRKSTICICMYFINK